MIHSQLGVRRRVRPKKGDSVGGAGGGTASCARGAMREDSCEGSSKFLRKCFVTSFHRVR